MLDGFAGLFIIFEVDEETMKYDEAHMKEDIALYVFLPMRSSWKSFW